jgi:hypothetical protein
MAAGDIVYTATGFSPYGIHTTVGVEQGWKVQLNKGGTTANNRVYVDLDVRFPNFVNAPFDINKQYEVTIKEV